MAARPAKRARSPRGAPAEFRPARPPSPVFGGMMIPVPVAGATIGGETAWGVDRAAAARRASTRSAPAIAAPRAPPPPGRLGGSSSAPIIGPRTGDGADGAANTLTVAVAANPVAWAEIIALVVLTCAPVAVVVTFTVKVQVAPAARIAAERL